MGEWLAEDRENLRQIKAMLIEILAIKRNMLAIPAKGVRLSHPELLHSIVKKQGRPRGSKNRRSLNNEPL